MTQENGTLHEPDAESGANQVHSTNKMGPLEIARFWSRVQGDTDFQCWPWRGRKGAKGYGRYGDTMAHRVAYELTCGPIPDGLVVRHRCDNPPCCNPSHLEAGTQKDNMADAMLRNRLARGTRNGNAKLVEAQVDYIRRNPDKRKQADLARELGVAESTVSMIRHGRRRTLPSP